MDITSVRALIRQVGQDVTLRRLTGTSLTATDVTCRAKVNDAALVEVEGALKQGRRKVVLDPTEAENAGWPLPPVPDDQVLIDGVAHQIEAVEVAKVGNAVALYRMIVVG